MPFDDVTELAARLERIKRLSEQLRRTQADSAEAAKLAKDIWRESIAAHELLKPIQRG
jgi:hypothetical protein